MGLEFSFQLVESEHEFAWTLGKTRASVSAETEFVPHSVPAQNQIPLDESQEVRQSNIY